MTPYYADDQVTLYHGDALEVMESIGSASVHAVVTDPPYVIGAVSAGSIGAKSGGWADMMNKDARGFLVPGGEPECRWWH